MQTKKLCIISYPRYYFNNQIQYFSISIFYIFISSEI